MFVIFALIVAGVAISDYPLFRLSPGNLKSISDYPRGNL